MEDPFPISACAQVVSPLCSYTSSVSNNGGNCDDECRQPNLTSIVRRLTLCDIVKNVMEHPLLIIRDMVKNVMEQQAPWPTVCRRKMVGSGLSFHWVCVLLLFTPFAVHFRWDESPTPNSWCMADKLFLSAHNKRNGVLHLLGFLCLGPMAELSLFWLQ